MADTFTISLTRQIDSARILDDYGKKNSAPGADQHQLTQGLETEKSLLGGVCRTLQSVVAKLNQFYDEIFAGHKEEIAGLSVEIARKVLVQKVQQGDYEIESIVKEAIKNAPTPQDVVIHLNPEDLAECQKAQQDEADDVFAGIKFIADSNIGRAECLLESPKGIIKSLIDEHLERIGKALEKAE